MKQSLLFYITRVAGLAVLSVGVAASSSTQAAKYQPLTGPVLVAFDDPQGGLTKRQFGIFRDEEDSPRDQFIEETVTTVKLPNTKQPVGFDVLAYNVTGAGVYNGWWLKLGAADWTQHERGELVLLLRRMDPARDKIGRRIRLALPDTACTSHIKVELKTKDAEDTVAAVGLRRQFLQEHEQEQDKKGYFELRIPLKSFSLDLHRVHELVLVFENQWTPPSQQHGALGIRAILLNSKVGEPITIGAHDADRLLDELGKKAFEGPNPKMWSGF